MYSNFTPDYTHIVDAAYNRRPKRIPLYEHGISPVFIGNMLNRDLTGMLEGDSRDLEEYFRLSAEFCRDYGYDVIAFEGCITELIQGGEGLCGRAPALIHNLGDIDRYPWDELPELYRKRFYPSFDALRKALPPGMKAVGGVGNGLFETVQDFVPLMQLAYLQVDDPQAFSALFQRIGTLFSEIWQDLLEKHADIFCLSRFGDDLGFKTSTLLHPETIRTEIIPQYRKIIQLVHARSRPFLLHSCGSIFSVMDDIIAAGIDAKHSNEDGIAPFTEWVDRYGSQIGNFGGFDMTVIEMGDIKFIHTYVTDILTQCDGKSGIAFGTGNQIGPAQPPEGFIAMVQAVREFRKE